jgi:hypothetical protein
MFARRLAARIAPVPMKNTNIMVKNTAPNRIVPPAAG